MSISSSEQQQPESPLDVLSRAADMVESGHSSENESPSQQRGCERSPSFKERHPKFRKSATPDYMMAADQVRSLKLHRQSSLSDVPPPPEEGPLDMSIKKRPESPPPPPPYRSISSHLPVPPPPAYKPPPYSSPPRDLPPPPSYESSTQKSSHNSFGLARFNKSKQTTSSFNSADKENEGVDRTIREITIITDSSADPLLDEHFRRSLGANYQALFKKQEDEQPPSPIPPARQSDDQVDPVKAFKEDMEMEGYTVEDHFAKALGDTWVKLQAKSESTSSDGPPSPSHAKAPVVAL